jgi:hypothetical protein
MLWQSREVGNSYVERPAIHLRVCVFSQSPDTVRAADGREIVTARWWDGPVLG